ncbi:papain-like cysteine protease family protein [Arsenicicoccus dermatophilus]|uniref:papain-like cysteine protease family protein n=1 Tax=Arsenicicoccus dermatophilus TaxID=1076331 RepID=UPI001F4C5E5A|nr:papain-like cysteine protease family protein [Arsenicicoccus dermatophilus]MCH8612138.1 C39 family peptidase [Arsenicicoccus dermatophilus]
MLSLSPLKALASVGAAAVALGLAPAVTAHADAPTRASAGVERYRDGSAELRLDNRAQQQTNWCWAATGSSIATYKGKSVSQNDFCNLAFRRSRGSCPNDQASLAHDQQAYRALGMNPGRYVYDALGFDVVSREINADRPILTRIQWSSGGGHMMAIVGVDPQGGRVEWYNPWPSDRRINVASYDYYVENSDFAWTHSLYGIGA